jgi:hypothetical protein
MGLKDPNRLDADAPRLKAVVLANPAVSPTMGWPVGVWWSELIHASFVFEEEGHGVEEFDAILVAGRQKLSGMEMARATVRTLGE